MSGEITSIGQALDTLVHQFADPWAFLRELVQNSIDAGSPEIDVELDYDEAGASAVIEVRDYGEGMSREIIDTRLTRLFSSAKEGDYTKIGRFGIGFVSVFAIQPDLVCIDTGRTGEYWRVLFKPDRSFERIRLNDPVEGTTVRLFKRLDPAEYEAARARAKAVLERWCKHARVEVRLFGEPISRPMTLAGPVALAHEEEGTQVVLAYVPERVALRGYYHGGLTLHEEHDDRLAHVAFKIDSRFLEHTLTRDNVLRDDNYEKAMTIVARLASGPLVEALFEALERRLAAPEPDEGELAQLMVWAEHEVREWVTRSQTSSWWRARSTPAWLERAVIPQLGGPTYSLAQLRELGRGRAIYYGRERSAISELLLARGDLVLACERDDPLASIVALVRGSGTVLAPLDELCTARPLSDDQRERWLPLLRAMRELLELRRHRIAALEVGVLVGAAVRERVAITQASFGELTPVSEAGRLHAGLLGERRVVVVNAEQPTLVHLRELAEREPELAAYLALELFYLTYPPGEGELDHVALVHQLAGAAAERRWRRSTP